MSAMVDFPKSAIPHRKPLPSGAPAQPAAHPHISHSHSRTASSNLFPAMPTSTSSAYPSGPAVEQYIQPTRRTLSNATTSTSSSGDRPAHNLGPVRTPSALRRSGSGRTTATTASIQPSSYVALMRKQKATVWSERAQHEDPRLLAAQRAAKMRAAMEVVGGPVGHRPAGAPSSSAAGSGGLRSKIRHHGATKATTYSGANMARAGVPMRLSANEVDEGDSEDEFAGSAYHRRTGSGRSSLGSDRRVTSSQYLAAPAAKDSKYSATTSPSGSGISPTNVPRVEDEASARSSYQQPGQNYFDQSAGLSKTSTGLTHTTSSSSGGSRENSFGQLAPMPEKKAEEREQAAKRKTTSDDLMRRGSVDERSMTMTGVRLFVANPDVDD